MIATSRGTERWEAGALGLLAALVADAAPAAAHNVGGGALPAPPWLLGYIGVPNEYFEAARIDGASRFDLPHAVELARRAEVLRQTCRP